MEKNYIPLFLKTLQFSVDLIIGLDINKTFNFDETLRKNTPFRQFSNEPS